MLERKRFHGHPVGDIKEDNIYERKNNIPFYLITFCKWTSFIRESNVLLQKTQTFLLLNKSTVHVLDYII